LPHEHVPRVLYEHPVVEYIPLAVMTLRSGPLPAEACSGPLSPPLALHALKTARDWERTASWFPFAFGDLHEPPQPGLPSAEGRFLHFLALGFQVTAAIYRDRKTSLVASDLGPRYHLFALPRIFFYKPRVDFIAYDAIGRQLVAVRAVDVGPRYRHRPVPPAQRKSRGPGAAR